MYNVITAWGNYPTRLRNGQPGPHTEEELGLMWLRHVAAFSVPGMLKKYRLVLLLPRNVVIPDTYNLDLDQWGDKKRFDENNKVQQWPLGPNMTFQQVLWLYAYNKLEGPFLWCEPDCIPIKADWLDLLFGEYERAKKPFMGALVEASTQNAVRVPKHMTANAIYPDKPYTYAPTLMECRGTPWDVYAAGQILQYLHPVNHLIQNELVDKSDPSPNNIATALYHPDKTGYLIQTLSSGGRYEHPIEDTKRKAFPEKPIGKPLVEVFEETPYVRSELEWMLEEIQKRCASDKEMQRKVAYFMLEHGIVNQGHLGQHMRKKAAARREAANAEPAA